MQPHRLATRTGQTGDTIAVAFGALARVTAVLMRAARSTLPGGEGPWGVAELLEHAEPEPSRPDGSASAGEADPDEAPAPKGARRRG